MSPSPDSFQNLSPPCLLSLIPSTILCAHSRAVKRIKKAEKDCFLSFSVLFHKLCRVSVVVRPKPAFHHLGFFFFFFPSSFLTGHCSVSLARFKRGDDFAALLLVPKHEHAHKCRQTYVNRARMIPEPAVERSLQKGLQKSASPHKRLFFLTEEGRADKCVCACVCAVRVFGNVQNMWT